MAQVSPSQVVVPALAALAVGGAAYVLLHPRKSRAALFMAHATRKVRRALPREARPLLRAFLVGIAKGLARRSELADVAHGLSHAVH